jgi:hypothetical protein
MTQTALTLPASIARNRSTAFRPGLSAMAAIPERLHGRAVDRIVEVHVRGQHVGQAAHFAPAHRVRLAGQRERAHARLPMRPVSRWQLMMALTLSVPLDDWFTPCE